jgi:hypothetical protein
VTVPSSIGASIASRLSGAEPVLRIASSIQLG